jgi:hypothetical protein
LKAFDNNCKFFVSEWGFRLNKPATENDTVCHLYPYFSLKNVDQFKEIWKEAYPATQAAAEAEQSHQYSFSFESNETASCREAYSGAEGILLHLKNVDVPLKSTLDGPAELLRLELHGPKTECEKLKEALDLLGCQYFHTEWGYRNAIRTGVAVTFAPEATAPAEPAQEVKASVGETSGRDDLAPEAVKEVKEGQDANAQVNSMTESMTVSPDKVEDLHTLQTQGANDAQTNGASEETAKIEEVVQTGTCAWCGS